MRRNRRRPKLTNVRTNRDCALHLEVRIRLAPVRQSVGSCVSPGLSTVNFNMVQSVLIDERLIRESYRARNCFETLSSLVMWTALRGPVQTSASPDLNARDSWPYPCHDFLRHYEICSEQDRYVSNMKLSLLLIYKPRRSPLLTHRGGAAAEPQFERHSIQTQPPLLTTNRQHIQLTTKQSSEPCSRP
jgi:hypothetical protein